MNKRIARMIRKSHIVLEVIDVRRPFETKCRMLERFLLKKKKPFIRVFNKADLVPKKFAEKVVSELGGVYISSKKRKGIKKLRQKIKKTLGGREKALICVVGYPNTGKSSLINCLKGRKSAGVAPVPGYTKGEQLIRIDKRIMMIDTPGVITYEKKEVLASKGALAPEKIKNPEKAANYIINKIMKHNKGNIKKLYKVEEEGDIIEKISNLRKWDRERTARKILQDWNAGKLKGYWF